MEKKFRGNACMHNLKKKYLKVSQGESMSEDRRESQGLYRREKIINLVDIYFAIEPNTTARGLKAEEGRRESHGKKNCIVVRRRNRRKNDVAR